MCGAGLWEGVGGVFQIAVMVGTESRQYRGTQLRIDFSGFNLAILKKQVDFRTLRVISYVKSIHSGIWGFLSHSKEF